MSLTFFIGVYDDQELAKKRILELGQFYPDCNIISFADGIFDPHYRDFCAANDVIYGEGERLKNKFVGRWTDRRLRFFMDKSQADYVVKIDPDTRVQARIDFPNTDVFAPLCPDTATTIAFSGCCFGMSRGAVSKVLEANLLLKRRYNSSPFCLEDQVLTEIFNKLKLEVKDIPQVLSNKESWLTDVSDYAFVHPVKS